MVEYYFLLMETTDDTTSVQQITDVFILPWIKTFSKNTANSTLKNYIGPQLACGMFT